MIALYDRMQSCFKRPNNNSSIQSESSPTQHTGAEQGRREQADINRREGEEAFLDVHLQKIRKWKKSQTDGKGRRITIFREGLGDLEVPAPVLHSYDTLNRVQKDPSTQKVMRASIGG